MNTRLHRATPLLILGLLAQAPGMAAQTIAEPGPETKQAADQRHQQHHRREPKRIKLPDSEGAVVRLWKPDLTTLSLQIEHGSVTLPPTGVDNYHALVVEKASGHLKTASIRYEYMRGKPSGHSTSELTAAEKTAFEIVPNPVPREHRHYLSGEIRNFVLRFNGAPAASIPTILETSHGTRVNAVSDSEGQVSLRIPDDFPDIKEGERDRRTAEFSVSAELMDAGITYQTQLIAEYRVDPSHWQSFGLGATVTGFGMLAGLFIGRIGRTDSRRQG